jgi:hypothetical protein
MIKNRKMMRISLVLIGLLLVTASSAFVVQKALAGSCFTDVANGSFWYSVTCWMKNKGISTGYADGSYLPDNKVTRGEMAFFVQRAFTNSTMVNYISTGPTSWTANGADGGYVQTFYGWSHLHSSATNGAMFNLSPSIPTSLYNTQMYVRGIKICFDAAYGGSANGFLDYIQIMHLYYTTSGFTVYKTATDMGNYNSVGCVVLNFASPSGLQGNDQVTVNLGVYFVNTSYEFRIGTTTVILEPSTSLAMFGIDEAEAAMLERGGVVPTEVDPASGLHP